MIKSISNNEVLNSPNSIDKKKPKQLTLFDLKSKSITLSNKENKNVETKDEVVMMDESENKNNKNFNSMASSKSDNSVGKDG